VINSVQQWIQGSGAPGAAEFSGVQMRDVDAKAGELGHELSIDSPDALSRMRRSPGSR